MQALHTVNHCSLLLIYPLYTAPVNRRMSSDHNNEALYLISLIIVDICNVWVTALGVVVGMSNLRSRFSIARIYLRLNTNLMNIKED